MCFSFADAFIVIAALFSSTKYTAKGYFSTLHCIFFVAKKRMNEAHFAGVVP